MTEVRKKEFLDYVKSSLIAMASKSESTKSVTHYTCVRYSDAKMIPAGQLPEDKPVADLATEFILSIVDSEKADYGQSTGYPDWAKIRRN